MSKSKQTLLNRDMFVDALRYMDESDLVFINEMVIERLNLLAQAKDTVKLSEFAAGDRICFKTKDGKTIYGHIVRLNKKTASIMSDDHQRWSVSPGFLLKA